ncbi:MAG TPA: HepT-like ribonuclease domain-containing protein [Acetobacteraceae bacterium]|nr:HepT-like ribonuclease domain-containing protein [Acetobacteraceae bacterium]
MPSSHDPAVCLADILDNIGRIRSYAGTMDRTQFEHDGRTRDAVERCLERIG